MLATSEALPSTSSCQGSWSVREWAAASCMSASTSQSALRSAKANGRSLMMRRLTLPFRQGPGVAGAWLAHAHALHEPFF
eukprot:13263946-Alexandrium_andersonii.AAC.1